MGIEKKIRQRTCLICGQVIYPPKKKYCSTKCNHASYYLRHKEKIKKNVKKWVDKNPIKAYNMSKKRLEKFRRKNPERFNKLMMRGYKNNKSKWKDRDFIRRHREEILLFLSPFCSHCGIKKIAEIGHKSYKNHKRIILLRGRGAKQKNAPLLKKYVKENLRGFCSRKCHSDFDKKMNKKEVKK